MDTDVWLSDIRVSYDTVAESYAELVRDSLDQAPFMRAAFSLFADLVRSCGSGPVADAGCGPGQFTQHLRDLGLDAFGIDLSTEMVELARRSYPGIRFEVGSMTDLHLDDASLAGLMAWYSLIHLPDPAVAAVFTQFRRVLRPSAPLLIGFHVGATSTHKTQGYGGHSMNVHIFRRRLDQMATWLNEAGFIVDAQMTVRSTQGSPAGIIFASGQP